MVPGAAAGKGLEAAPEGRAALAADPVAETRPLLRRLERTAAAACMSMAAVAFLLWPRTVDAGLGVLGGGGLAWLSYWALSGLVTGLGGGPVSRRTGVGMLVKFFTRHAILAIVAYGMMVRLGAHPVALVMGVTSIGMAAAVEAVRVVAAGNQAR